MTDLQDLTKVLVRPLVTEKSTRLQETGSYTFEVALHTNKGIVKQAVERVFNVDVINVNVLMVRGRRRRFGPRWVRSPDWKKAIVTLKPGQKITIFEGT
ncbi:MAG: 50S ribosomal protein L23 [Chloroflexi bacterium]|nr:50S ribosomal protein L23 [Chloroflexota bacterium]